MSGGALLSALAPSALAASEVGRPPASFGKGDVGILNYALTLEYLEAAFYNGATAANMSLNAQTSAFLKVVTADENAHVAFLKQHLGSKAAKEPKFDFKGANTSPEMFMKTAEVLENTGVHAYSGQALNIKSPAYVKAALSILTIEARHASVIGLLNEPTGNDIAPERPVRHALHRGKGARRPCKRPASSSDPNPRRRLAGSPAREAAPPAPGLDGSEATK